MTTPEVQYAEVTGPDRPAERVPLPGSSAVVGRSADAGVRLDHPKVSRAHARLDRRPDGRWQVTDLKSHNGTRVNGAVVAEAVLVDGDLVEVGPFALKIGPAVARSAARQASVNTTVVDGGRIGFTDDTSRVIRTLAEIAPPRLAVEQLRGLDEFGRQVLETEPPADRLVALCQLMLHPRFGGRWAVVVSVPSSVADAEADPVPLCPVQQVADPAAAFAPTPRLSRGLVRAARRRNEPMMASHVPPGEGVEAQIELSIAPGITPMAAVAVPVSTDDGGRMTLLYAAFPPEYGTGEWLALASLAARNYRQAEAVWANIASNRKLAVLENELGRARRVQDRLVPRQCRLPGLDLACRFTPCHGVAGDYVDTLTLPDGHALLVVADVSGKGLPAALVAMGVHTLVHATVRRWSGLADLAAALDDHLADALAPETFVTFFAVTLDPATGAMDVVNGGHPPAFAVGRGGGVRPIGTDAGFPLGTMPQTLPVSADVLADDETLVLFTDGCYEVFDAAETMLGPDGFALLAAGPITSLPDVGHAADRIGQLLDDWQGPGEPGDDRTLLLVRRRA